MKQRLTNSWLLLLSLMPVASLHAKYIDQENGSIYYGHRYHSPSGGRWLSRDPIGERGGLNVYAACKNEPVDKVDPKGLVGMGDVHASCHCWCLFAIRIFDPGNDEMLLDWYTTPGGQPRFGNKITYTWFVTGNPSHCQFFTDEAGTSLTFFDSEGNDVGSVAGQNGNSWSEGAVLEGNIFASTIDYLGATPPPNMSPGQYSYNLILRASTRCINSYGRTTTETFPDVTASGSFTVPRP